MVEVNKSVGRPEAPPHFVARNQLTWMAEKHGQDFEGLSDEFDPRTKFPQLVRVQVHFVRPEARARLDSFLVILRPIHVGRLLDHPAI